MFRSARSLALTFTLLALSSAVLAQAPTTAATEIYGYLRLGQKDWFAISMLGEKVGHMTQVIIRTGSGPDALYEVRRTTAIGMVNYGEEEVESSFETLVYAATPPHRMLRFRTEAKSPSSERVVEGVTTADGIALTIRSGDQTREIERAGHPQTLADEVMHRWWPRTPGLEVGARQTFRGLNTESLDFEDVTLEILDVGEPRRVSVTSEESGRLEIHVDAAGLELLLFGDGIELRSGTEEEATAAGSTADIFEKSSIFIDRFPGPAHLVEELVVAVDEKLATCIPAGARQSVEKTAEGRWLVKLGPQHGIPQRATDAEIADALRETADHPIQHEAAVALAGAVAEVETARDKVATLVTLVGETLEYDPGLQPLSVEDALRERRGDCSEYSDLFTTVARAAGLPARTVGGFVFLDTDEHAFGPHAWNEVVIDGHWHPVDATWGEMELSATHVSFGPGTRAALASLGIAGSRLVLVSVTPDPTKDPFDRSGRPATLDLGPLALGETRTHGLYYEGTRIGEEARGWERVESEEGTFLVRKLDLLLAGEDDDGIYEMHADESWIFRSTPPYDLLRIEHTTTVRGDVMSITATVGPDRTDVWSTNAERSLETRIWHSVLDEVALASWLRDPTRKVGDTVSLPRFDEDDWRVVATGYTLRAVEGERAERRYTVDTAFGGAAAGHLVIDGQGGTVSGVFADEIERRLDEPEEAK